MIFGAGVLAVLVLACAGTAAGADMQMVEAADAELHGCPSAGTPIQDRSMAQGTGIRFICMQGRMSRT
ncbi:MAG: hypothetical protein U9N36_01915 [Euryarchaeota archaeon]|nr:hypothetical protein [Euryarchaeota archaeon]